MLDEGRPGNGSYVWDEEWLFSLLDMHAWCERKSSSACNLSLLLRNPLPSLSLILHRSMSRLPSFVKGDDKRPDVGWIQNHCHSCSRDLVDATPPLLRLLHSCHRMGLSHYCLSDHRILLPNLVRRNQYLTSLKFLGPLPSKNAQDQGQSSCWGIDLGEYSLCSRVSAG